jgi:hypothetical protein
MACRVRSAWTRPRTGLGQKCPKRLRLRAGKVPTSNGQDRANKRLMHSVKGTEQCGGLVDHRVGTQQHGLRNVDAKVGRSGLIIPRTARVAGACESGPSKLAEVLVPSFRRHRLATLEATLHYAAKAFCHGERGAVITSSMPIIRTRSRNPWPYDVSRSRSR